jgi:hypothetical protein
VDESHGADRIITDRPGASIGRIATYDAAAATAGDLPGRLADELDGAAEAAVDPVGVDAERLVTGARLPL